MTSGVIVQRSTTLILALAAGAAVVGISILGSKQISAQEGITVPSLSAAAAKGQTLYQANCSTCHGTNAAGTDKGPPFIHKVYEPNHHGDAAFQRAAKNGARAHHWPFGNMPPVPNVTEADVTLIIKYVRELQRANGIR
jgi:mono/diheme cytochrome c family protein